MVVLGSIYFDVVIVSLAMDDPDGMLIAENAKATQHSTKVIVVSGKRAPDRLNFCVDAFVMKPFSLVKIKTAINSVLARAA
jgi:DNA-binding response OmpR family regulator